MNSWCESCARKNCCYTMEIIPKCYLPTTNTAHGTPETYLAKSLRYSRDSHEIAEQTENSSEKPNNCDYAENPSGDVWECGCFLDTYCEHQIYDRNPDGTINIVECGYEPKDEPTCSKMEQVDKNIYVRSKDEPQTEVCDDCIWHVCNYNKAFAEPQTCSVNGRPYDCGNCEYHKCTADEPQIIACPINERAEYWFYEDEPQTEREGE